MKSYLLIVCLSFLALFTNAQTTVVKWTFDDSNLIADAGIEANAAKTISAVATAQNFTYPTGLNTTQCLSETGWDAGVDTKYWQIEFVTTGYQTLTLSSFQKSSNSGPKDFKAQYKVGESGTWTDISGAVVVCANDNFILGVLTNVALPAECDNQASVFIRYLITSTVSSNNSTVAATGTSRIEDLEIKGVEMGGSDLTPPAFTATYPKVQSLTETSFDLAVQLNEAGTAYYQVLADGATAPTVSELIANGTSIAVANANTTYTAAVSALTAQTAYDVYVVAQDDETTPNVQASVTLLNVMTLGGVASSDLFFSEYVEGSANNKAIEIYNPNDVAVDLSSYSVMQAYIGSNGTINAWGYLPEYRFQLSGTLAPGDVYVLYATGADAAIVAQGDWTGAYGTDTTIGQTKLVYFNGNDAMGLFKNGVLIDVVGQQGVNDTIPCAGIPKAGLDHTLVRKFAVTTGNTNWIASAGTDAASSEWVVYPVNTFNYLGYHGLSTAAEITAFSFSEQTGPAAIDAVNATIAIEVGNGTDITALTPTIVVSPGAQVSPTGVINFTNPVVFRVTAEDMLTYKDWTVTVTVASVSTETEITGFVLAQQTSAAVIDLAAHTVACEVAEGSDLTHLAPTITLSYGATVVPASGDSIDFSAGPVVYTVTAEDGTTTQPWSVTVTEQQIIVTPIRDIQFTVDSLNANATIGGSSFVEQIVTTEGIVTGVVPTKGFFIQDGVGAWSGLYIYTVGSTVVPVPAVGDQIRVTGKVKEYFGYTELTTITAFTIVSSNNTLPASIEISAAEVGERFEGTLVYLHNYTCVNVDFDNHNNSLYVRGEETDTLMVHSLMLYPFDPILNSSYSFTGVVNFDWDNFKVEPRDSNDVVIESIVNTPPSITDIQVSPNPPVLNEEIQVSALITDDSEEIGREFYWGYSADNIEFEATLSLVSFVEPRYGAVIPSQTDSTHIYFKFVAFDSYDTTIVIGNIIMDSIFNTAPSISEIQITPDPVMLNQEILISAIITDNDVDFSREFRWGYSEDNLNFLVNLFIVNETESRFGAIIPAQSTAATIFYEFKAYDDEFVTIVAGNFVISSIDKVELELVKLYPNPVNNFIVVGSDLVEKVIISNLLGANVVEAELNGENQKVDVSALSSGVYMVTLVDRNGNRATQRIVKN